MELSEQEQVRRQSLQALRDLGINPYPAAEYQVTGYSSDIKAAFVDREEGAPEPDSEWYTGKPVSIAGRLMSKRIMGKASFIELQDYVKPLGVVDMSLQKLYANFFGQKISKTQRLTNWEADVLTEAQKRYAATDAWTCLRLYDIITELFNTHAYRLVLVPEPETSKS